MRKFEICKGFENNPNVKIPIRNDVGSAGYDFFSIETTIIPPGEVKLVSTGIKAFMQWDEVLKLYNRSSNPIKKGVFLANSCGIIDAKRKI